MATKYFTCQQCGKEVRQKQRDSHQYKYCLVLCYHDARFGKKILGELNSMRNPKCLEAVKLCAAGLTQAEAARRVGIEIYILKDWLSKYGSAAIFTGRVCGYCGKTLEGMKHLSNRKYCSETCRNKARYAEKQPSERRRAKSNPQLCAEALELYWGGLNQRAIAQHFGIADGTVYSWINRFGDERERLKTITATRIMPLKQRLREAETGEEWLNAVRELAPWNESNAETQSVRLVCRVINGQSSYNQLITIITERLRLNPFSGDIFAFCSKLHGIVTTIAWKGTMFNIVKIPRLYGAYFWPHESFGPIITVSSHEFEFLISCYKRNCEKQRNAELT